MMIMMNMIIMMTMIKRMMNDTLNLGYEPGDEYGDHIHHSLHSFHGYDPNDHDDHDDDHVLKI